MAVNLHRATILHSIQSISAGVANVANMLLDSDTEKIAYKYYPVTTSPITDIDVRLNINGTVTDTNFTFQVETDLTDAPSGTLLGTATAEWAGPAADEWTGLKALATNTGALTLNTPVWVVLQRTSGGSLSGTDYIQGQYAPIAGLGNIGRGRHHNGTDWTTTAVSTVPLMIIIKHLDGTITGVSVVLLTNYTTAPDIFSTNKQGLRLKYGCQIKIVGVMLQITKTGTPNSLVADIYEGATLKYSETILQANIITNAYFSVYFTSPVLLTANTNIYIILSQTGTSDANDYDSRGFVTDAAYVTSVYPTDIRFVYGTSSDPTALTVADDFLALIHPLIDDPAVEFDEAAGGGGGGPVIGGRCVQ